MAIDDTSSGTNTLLYVSVIGFAIVSYVLYKFVLSPTQPAQQQQTIAASTSRTIRPSTSNISTASSTTTTTKNNTDNDDYKFGQSRHPSHLLPPSNWSINREDLSGYLLKGIIPFRSTYANGYETRLQQQQEQKKQKNNEQAVSSSKVSEEVKDLVVVNRKERARIFARMFSSTTSTSSPTKPPNRGSNIVITIHHTDVITTTSNSVDSKLHKVLYLLGTYYNVFVLVDASDVEPKITNDEEVKEYIDKIRTQLYTNNNNNSSDNEYQLNKQIIPTHRIIVTTTSSGRVAFVRQLADTQLVIDYDVEGVVKELERFGFRTLCYPRVEGGMGEGGCGESYLGKFLIP